MADVQKENGYTALANELLEAIIKAGLNGAELAILFYVARKTYGFNKKQDAISITQFEKALPFTRRAITRALKSLQVVNILTLVNKGTLDGLANTYQINKDYQSWEVVNKNTLVTILAKGSDNFGKKVVNKKTPTKDNYKRHITKDISDEFFQAKILAKKLFEKILINNPNFKYTKPELEGWIKDFDLMLRRDNRDFEEAKELIDFCQDDNFWRANILSGAKFREKYDQLKLKKTSNSRKIY